MYKPYEFKEQHAYDFANHVGAKTRTNGDELQFRICPYCKPAPTDRRNLNSFSINLRTGQFKCLRESCGAHGNMLSLSRDFDFSLGWSVDEYYKPKKQYRKLNTPKKAIVPKEPAIKYLESRGISEETAKNYEITVQKDNENILVFPFFDEKGLMQFVKYRKTDFNKDKDKNKEWCEANCKPILFGMKQCKDFKRLVVCEGQLDSLSVSESGIDNAVSVPNGSKGFTWIPYCWNWISKFEEIVIFGDYEKGRITLLSDFQKRFNGKIKHVREEDYNGCKDANEILQKYGKDSVRKAVENAIFTPIPKVVQLADVEDVDIYKLEKLSTTLKEMDSLLYGGLPFGGVVIITGKPGEGKSTLASQILGNAINSGHKVFAYSGELPNYLFKSWLDFQIAGPQHVLENTTVDGNIHRFISNQNRKLISDWYRDKAFLYDNRIVEGDEHEDLLKTVENTIMQYGVDVILVDNLMTAIDLDAEKSSDKYEKQSIFVKKMTRLALKYNVLILLVAHKRKNNFSTNENDEVGGSGDITNLATITIGYSKDRELSDGYRRVTVSKNRLFGKTNTNGYLTMFDEKSKRIYGEKDDFRVAYGWDKSDGFVNADDMQIPF